MTAPTDNEKTAVAPVAWIGYLIGALGAAFFATKGIVIKLAMIEGVDAVTTLTWRMIIAVPLFGIMGWLGWQAKRRKNPDFKLTWPLLLRIAGIGATGYYIASYLDFAGLEYITAQFDRLILLTYPFFVMLFGAMFFGGSIGPRRVGALLISYAGLALIFAHDLSLDGANVIIGALLVLGAAIAYAFYQLMAKPVIDEIGAPLFTSIALSSAGVAVVVHFLFTHEFSDLAVSPNAMWLMLAMGTVSTVLPAYLIATSIGMIGPTPTAVMGNVSPIVTIALAVTVLGEPFTIWHAAGAAMVLGGIIYFARRQDMGKIKPTGPAEPLP